MLHRSFRVLARCTIAVSLASPNFTMGQEVPSAPDLSNLSLEDLTHIDVSSVSRKPQELFKIPAAVFVITREDIKQSGANSLQEVFRMVPGMQVAQIDANTWAISARGFNGRFVDKMLVLIDGRTIYSEIYSGVFWDQNDMRLEDIDRIEVIRGPGGTLWGANAVNGVINIITRPARQTLGTKVDLAGGSMEEAATVRHGAELGSNFQYRTSVKYLRHNSLPADDGSSSNDGGGSITVGGRGDLQATAKDSVTFHGNFIRMAHGERFVGPLGPEPGSVYALGGYALGRWEHRLAGSEFVLQTYYADAYRTETAGAGREHILDFDFQHHLPTFHRNDVVWGLGYRVTTDRIFSNPSTFTSDHHLDDLYGLFFQDDIAVVRNKLVVTGGLKLQHNSYTGFEIQPGGRVRWTPDVRHSLWASVARAVRTPSAQDLDLHLFKPVAPENGLTTEVLALGNPNFQSEVLMAYESGYRQSIGHQASIDITGFINSYSKLRNQEFLGPYLIPGLAPTLVIPIIYGNNAAAKTHGIEVLASWNPLPSLHLQAGGAWMNGDLRLSGGPSSIAGDPWASPTNAVNLRVNWNFARHWTFNSAGYFVSRLERTSPTGIAPVKAFLRLDEHVSFHLFESVVVSAGGNNLLQSRHPEFDPEDGYTVRSVVPRSAFLKVVWSF